MEQARQARLTQLSEHFREQQENSYTAATNLALKCNLPLVLTNSDGSRGTLMGVDEGGRPIYIGTGNVNAADTISADELAPGGSSGLNLNGEGISVGVWDEGGARVSHQEFSGRVVIADGGTSINPHNTHVTGTICAAGIVAAAKGMASSVRVYDNNFQFDIFEMTEQVRTNQLRISNHSYGSIAVGWYGTTFVVIGGIGQSYPTWWGDLSISHAEDYKFGRYGATGCCTAARSRCASIGGATPSRRSP